MSIARWCSGFLLLAAACHHAPKPQPVKLTLFGLSVDAAEQLRQDALEEFTRTTGIEVEPIPTVGNSDEQLKLALRLLNRGASAPDLFVMDVTWPGVMNNQLLDLTGTESDDRGGHLPALIENDTVGRRLVALPFYVNAGVLFYRADLLEQYGYSAPPKSWTDLDRMARRIQDGERKKSSRPFWGFIWQGAEYEGLTCNALEWQRSFGGGSLIESDGSVSVNNRGAAEAFATAARRVNLISPPGVLSYMETDTLNVFQTGGAAFMRYWSSGFRAVADMPHGRAEMTLLPAGPAGRAQSIGGFQLGISRETAHPREAAALISYLTGREVQKRRAIRRGYVPTRPVLYEDPDVLKALPYIKMLREVPPSSWVLRPSAVAAGKYSEVSHAYSETIHRILANQTRPLPGLQQLEHRLQKIMDSRGPLRH